MNEETIKQIITNIDEKLDAIQKQFETYMKDTSCQIKELNEFRIRHDEQITMIKERNKNKDIEIITVMANNAKEHEALIKEQNILKKQQWIWTGAIAVIVFVAQFVVNFILKRVA